MRRLLEGLVVFLPLGLSKISVVVLSQLQRFFFRVLRQITPSCIQRPGDAKHKNCCAIELFKQVCTLINDEHGSQNKGIVHGGAQRVSRCWREKWMKNTSSSCSIVATLIATVMFAAAFTVPGGNNGETGAPIFLQTDAFLVFIILDALALFPSLTSVLLFLSILTARYAGEDFTESLPKRLILGLASLFFAINAMMVAFGATLSIVLAERLRWIVLPIVSLSSILVAVFILLQLPLFIQMVRSTFGFTFRPQTPW